MEEQKNYAALYGKKYARNAEALTADITAALSVPQTEAMDKLAAELEKLQRKMAAVAQNLQEERQAAYAEKYSTTETPVLCYHGPVGNYEFDCGTGRRIDENDESFGPKAYVDVGTMNGIAAAVVGHNYETGCVIVNCYKYSIKSSKASASVRLLATMAASIFTDTNVWMDVSTRQKNTISADALEDGQYEKANEEVMKAFHGALDEERAIEYRAVEIRPKGDARTQGNNTRKAYRSEGLKFLRGFYGYAPGTLLDPEYEATDKVHLRENVATDECQYLTVSILRKLYKQNAAFEVIVRTAPSDVAVKMLGIPFEQAQPVHKLLGLEPKVYEKAKNAGVLPGFVSLIRVKELAVPAAEQYDAYNAYWRRDATKLAPVAKQIVALLENMYTGTEWLTILERFKDYEAESAMYQIGAGDCYGRDAEYQVFNNVLGHNWDYSLFESILTIYFDDSVFYDNYSFARFADYICSTCARQGYKSFGQFAGELCDYIKMCRDQNSPPKLFPDYLKVAHDVTAMNHQIYVAQHEEEIFRSRYDGFKPWQKNGWIVLAPQATEDLVREGNALNHCVGSYVSNVVRGNCRIFFLRKEKDQSLITFEERSGQIVQVRGLHDRMPNRDEIEALKQYAADREIEYPYAS